MSREEKYLREIRDMTRASMPTETWFVYRMVSLVGWLICLPFRLVAWLLRRIR